LDKGQRENWFASGFIFWLSIIAGTALLLFVIVEFFAEHPVVDLRAFRNISFSTGNVVMFFTFFSLFGSIILLPVYLQTLMGYTSTLAGMVLGPGGLATLIAMPLAGRLVTRVNPKGLLALGLAICAYATFLMSQFDLYADFNTLIWPRIVLGVGMGLLFIPLTTLTLSTVKKEAMGNATGIYNLLRNLGGSFGVAFVTTMLERREQFHQSRLVEYLTPFDRNYRFALEHSSRILHYKGLEPLSKQAGQSLLYGELLRQASMLSFNDVFRAVSTIVICVLPLVLLMRRGKTDATAGMH
ncbi:MAG TPA: MFS transporter, partial [Dissulfurispiraceae bacterium]|nr:MFS transporter [Dissulfurispiraceae bacterium]